MYKSKLDLPFSLSGCPQLCISTYPTWMTISFDRELRNTAHGKGEIFKIGTRTYGAEPWEYFSIFAMLISDRYFFERVGSKFYGRTPRLTPTTDVTRRALVLSSFTVTPKREKDIATFYSDEPSCSEPFLSHTAIHVNYLRHQEENPFKTVFVFLKSPTIKVSTSESSNVECTTVMGVFLFIL